MCWRVETQRFCGLKLSWVKAAFVICCNGMTFSRLDGIFGSRLVDSTCFITEGGGGSKNAAFFYFFLPNNDALVTSEARQTKQSFSGQGHIPRVVIRGRRMAHSQHLSLVSSAHPRISQLSTHYLSPSVTPPHPPHRPRQGRKRGGCEGCGAEIWQCLLRARYRAQKQTWPPLMSLFACQR